jgi:hypothetical protein
MGFSCPGCFSRASAIGERVTPLLGRRPSHHPTAGDGSGAGGVPPSSRSIVSRRNSHARPIFTPGISPIRAFMAKVSGFIRSNGTYTKMPLLQPEGMSGNWIVGTYISSTDEIGQPFYSGFLDTPSDFTAVHVPDSRDTTAKGVNAQGTIVGDAFMWADHRNHAYVTNVNGADFQFLEPPFPSSTGYGATGINNLGDIIGGYDGGGWALVDGTYHQFNVPGGATFPLFISDKREIAGVYCVPDGTCYGFILANDVYTTVQVPGQRYTEVRAIHPNPKKWTIYVNTGEWDNQQAYIGIRGSAKR